MSELDSAIRAWRKTKHPRFAVIADLASARALTARPRAELPTTARAADVSAWNDIFTAGDPLDVPRLMTALAAGKNSVIAVDRLRLLAERNDPRVISGVLALLESPPYRARTAMPFFRTCIELLRSSGDPRVKPAFESLSARYKAIIETSVGIDVSSLLRTAAKALDTVAPDESMATTADALEMNFTDELRARRSAVTAERDSHKNDDALLAAIIAAPDDDTPRLVYADALAERGDPRAELISLQIARARGTVSDAQYLREVELLADRKRLALWALPLSQGGECTFARGFPSRLVIDSRSTKNIVNAPLLGVLDSVEGFGQSIPIRAAKALLNSPALRGVRHVGGLTAQQLESLEGDAPWRSVQIDQPQEGVPWEKLRGVRRLSINWFGDEPRPSPFAKLAQLEHLHLHRYYEGLSLAPFLEGVSHLESFAVSTNARLEDLNVVRRLPKLKALRVRSDSIKRFDSAWVRALPLESLDVEGGDPAALIDVLPSLQSLRLDGFAALPMLRSFLEASRTNLKHVAFGPLALENPFTGNGVARLTSMFELGDGKRRESLLDAVALLDEDCVQRIEVKPLFDDPHKSINEPTMRLLEGLCRMRAKVPVVVRWQ